MKPEGLTVFGAGGFIGGRLVRRFASSGQDVRAITRETFPSSKEYLGHVFYAIGLTADFRGRPFETVEAHVCRLAEILADYRYASFLYLSSTRVYRGAKCTSEDEPLLVVPGDGDRFYDATKLVGEALCLAQSNPCVRVARLSNIVGPDPSPQNFFASVFAEARTHRVVSIRTAPGSSKDYLHVDDACLALSKIAQGGQMRLYNVASGANATNAEIAQLVERHTGARVNFDPDAPEIIYPTIDTRRLANEVAWHPRSLADMIPHIVAELDEMRAGVNQT